MELVTNFCILMTHCNMKSRNNNRVQYVHPTSEIHPPSQSKLLCCSCFTSNR